MNDFLEYMHMDPLFRSGNHGKLTFSMDYAYSENFIQVLSHDEVVHGKGSMINKMPGELDDQFANMRQHMASCMDIPARSFVYGTRICTISRVERKPQFGLVFAW